MPGFFDPMGQSLSTAWNWATSPYGSATNNVNKALNSIDSTNASLASSHKSAVAGNKATSAASAGQSAWASESAALNARIAQLSNQLAQQPRLPEFDILGNYNRAKQTATQAVTPLYNKKLNLFLEGQGIKKDTKTKETALGKENSTIALQNALADNTTGRVRTGQDLESALQQIATGETQFLQDSGTQFDEARRGLQDELAAAGGTDTGLGQQEIAKQLTNRNTSDGRQLEEFTNQKAAKQLLSTRTIEDLATSDTRQTQKKGQDDKAMDIDFDSYMASLANEEQGYRLQNDLDMALEISRQTSSNQQQGVAEFIASLAGSGARAQDIAYAKQVYM